MDVLRYSRNVWGQTVLDGVAFDLIGVFFTATLMFIVIHALYMWFFFAQKKNNVTTRDE